jgi:hypothetical protein
MIGLATGVIGAAYDIPSAAWEQAVFVCLFLLTVGILLNWQSRQSEKTQSFIERLNLNWQTFLKEHEAKNDDALKQVAQALNCLTEKMDDHDKNVERRIQTISNAAMLEAHTQPLNRRKSDVKPNE